MASPIHAILLLCLCFISAVHPSTARGGFTVDLIHRDSPRSPFYDPSLTQSQRIQNAITRSISRAHRITSTVNPSTSTPIESTVLPNGGEYLMTLSIGSPAVSTLAIADTGSDLIWTQCKPCNNCYKQEAPLFDPDSSKTYRNVSCQSQACSSLPTSSCVDSDSCYYEYNYGDRSYTHGFLATETFSFDTSSGQKVKFPKKLFGCGHENDGTFDGRGAGLVGLGNGPLSLVSQLGQTKFSYCLVRMFLDTNSTSSLNFGDSAVSGGVSTPLYAKETFYYLSLEKLSVAGNEVAVNSPTSIKAGNAGDGNIIIDSGTTLTLLPPDTFEGLVRIVKRAVKLTPVEDSRGTFGLCYDGLTVNDVPDIVFHFTGADVTLKPINTFLRPYSDNNLVCFAFLANEDLPILGNLAQQNFNIEYDLGEEKLTFKQTNCAKL